jgi:hypothetical protein
MGRSSGKERERYTNAMSHLSRFDRELTKNRFDKDLLDGAIEDVNNLVNHNTLSSGDRDRLSQDLRQLRNLRASRGMSY